MAKSQTESRSRNIVLIGFMGVGKTSVGKLLARSLGFEFVDTDSIIVRRSGKPITEIFAEIGESGFRDIESSILAELAGRSGTVIATGGGIVTREANIERLHAAGLVVWLDATADAIFERVSGNNERPLLQTDDPLATIRDLLDKRRPLYERAADQRVETGGLDSGELAYGIAESARLWFSTN